MCILMNLYVVSYSISTSNHNFVVVNLFFKQLYLIPFLHQTTTLSLILMFPVLLYLIPFLHQTTTLLLTAQKQISCILFHFYIKPQLRSMSISMLIVVSYSISTSNHNVYVDDSFPVWVVSYSISTSNHNLWRIRYYFQAHYHLNHILFFNGML